VPDFIQWNHQMISLLRQLITSLLDTVEVWNHFTRKEIGYFRCESDPPNPLASPLGAIEKSFQELERLHKKLQNLRKELCGENPQRVSCPFYSEFQLEMLPSMRDLRDTVANQHSSMLIFLSKITILPSFSRGLPRTTKFLLLLCS
jgi:hypothetical protein